MKCTSLKTYTLFSSKKHRVPFHSTSPHRMSNILDLVHTDFCMMDGKYLGGVSFFLLSLVTILEMYGLLLKKYKD